MATAAVTTEYCNLSLQELRESPTNPRQHFEENALKELAAYVPGHISCLCVARRFVPEDSKLSIKLGGALFEGHITCNGGTCRSDAAMRAR
jgi:hypothetical protein